MVDNKKRQRGFGPCQLQSELILQRLQEGRPLGIRWSGRIGARSGIGLWGKEQSVIEPADESRPVDYRAAEIPY